MPILFPLTNFPLKHYCCEFIWTFSYNVSHLCVYVLKYFSDFMDKIFWMEKYDFYTSYKTVRGGENSSKRDFCASQTFTQLNQKPLSKQIIFISLLQLICGGFIVCSNVLFFINQIHRNTGSRTLIYHQMNILLPKLFH